jgi:hypothetical protein
MAATRLKLEHIGEPLAVALLTLAHEQGSTERVLCRSPQNGGDLSLGELLRRESSGCPISFKDSVPVHPVEHNAARYCLDGQSQIDCLVVYGTRGTAIEVKLGVNRMSRDTFQQRFLSPCSISKHRPPRLKGNMIALLDRRLDCLSADSIPVIADLDGNRLALSQTWLLLIRRKVWLKWGSGTNCPSFGRNTFIVLLEELVESVGGPTVFDGIVSGIIGDGFARAWGLV